jgi:enoyl-CoA hydratase/3-hydroxyacyl-CoA dehydrogenase
MDSEHILYGKEEHVAWVTLNRPKALNALNRNLWRGIVTKLTRAEKDDEVRAVILTGAGRALSAGDDIKEVLGLRTAEDFRAFFGSFASPALEKILTVPKPVIAAVNGLAYGGGCEIVMLCDLAIASDEATFAVPEALIGAIPPIASVIGTDVVGRLTNNHMMFTGEPISAKRAKQVGLVNAVVAPGDLRSAATALAKKTMRASPSSITAMKRLVNRRIQPQDLARSVEQLVTLLQSEDGKEGHQAFVEKRKPRWLPDEG